MFLRRFLTLSVLFLSAVVTVQAHHPDCESRAVRQRIDVIGPLGNRLKMSHRRRCNRPSNLGGAIAYHIAPSSQEAMAWHNATHRGYYKNDQPRIVTHYFSPKPWEVLPMGARESLSDENRSDLAVEQFESDLVDDEMALRVDEPLVSDNRLIEEQGGLNDE